VLLGTDVGAVDGSEEGAFDGLLLGSNVDVTVGKLV
jgi:hypothetical protein